jgi:hypothetical protein
VAVAVAVLVAVVVAVDVAVRVAVPVAVAVVPPPLTFTVPIMPGWMAQEYENEPALLNVNGNDPPGTSVPECQALPSPVLV